MHIAYISIYSLALSLHLLSASVSNGHKERSLSACRMYIYLYIYGSGRYIYRLAFVCCLHHEVVHITHQCQKWLEKIEIDGMYIVHDRNILMNQRYVNNIFLVWSCDSPPLTFLYLERVCLWLYLVSVCCDTVSNWGRVSLWIYAETKHSNGHSKYFGRQSSAIEIQLFRTVAQTRWTPPLLAISCIMQVWVCM